MANSKKLYVSTAATYLFAAKNIASQYGWLKSETQGNSLWLVIDTYYKKAFYTSRPPSSDGGSVTVTSITEVKSYMPAFESGNTNLPAAGTGEYDGKLVLYHDNVLDPNIP